MPIIPYFGGAFERGWLKGHDCSEPELPSGFFLFHGKYQEMFWHPNKPLENRTRQRKWAGFAGYCTIMAKHSYMCAGNVANE